MKIKFLLIVFLFSVQLKAQTCCKNSATNNSMNSFAGDKSFVAIHLSPPPFIFSGKGTMISFTTEDGKTGGGYLVKSINPTDNYLFVFHEWWGLNDYIMKRADELQNELGNVNVIALDIYDGKVAVTGDSAGAYMSAVSDLRIENIIKGAIAYAGKSARISTIGWCFGGGLSLRAAMLAGKQSVGCVMYYGMPFTDMEQMKQLQAPVFGIFASRDKWITPEVVNKFQSDMKSADRELTVLSYDADHAFANPSNPHYDKTFADEANAIALKFLKNCFK